MKTTLITGSDGLIGKSLLSKYDINTVQLCDLKTGQDFRSIQVDENVNTVFHLAAVSRVIDADLDPAYALEINQESIPDFIKKCGRERKIILASSKEVFGSNMNEVSEYSPKNPISHYATTKDEMEKIAEHFYHLGFDISIIRFSTVFGALNDHATRVIPLFIRQALCNTPLTVIGDTKLVFPTYVDAVTQYVKDLSLQKNRTNEKMVIRNFVANGILLIDLARLIVRLCNSESEIIILNKDTNYASSMLRTDYPNTSLFGWEKSLDFYIRNIEHADKMNLL